MNPKTKIHKAKELLAKLTHLTLIGEDNGVLQWVGTKAQWDLCQ